MKFAPSNTRLTAPHFAHHSRHASVPVVPSGFGLALLVIRLPTYTNKFTSFGETQAGDLPLLDDPPEGFFTSFTPYSLRTTSSIASSNCVF